MIRSPHLRRAAALLALLVCPLIQASAPAQDPPAAESLVVAVRESPPFAMRDSAGNWEGLSVELWQDVADKLNLSFDWREMPLSETLDALEEGTVDVAVAALTITGERESRFDFSHPYHVSGLALGYRPSVGTAWLDVVRGFFSLDFLTVIGSLVGVLLAAGAAVWLFERRDNSEQFGGDPIRGLGDGFWWSAVTMTTVGYGDKAPRTLGGRLVALVWMFTSLVIIAGFTAAIAASLTANRLQSDQLVERGLGELSVGVLEGSAGDDFATPRARRVRRYASVPDAVGALEREEIDVILHDAPILEYHVRTSEDWLAVSDRVLVRDDYGFGLPSGSLLRKPVNTALLSILHEPVWQNIRRRFLGDAGAE